jgi:hypothetical protein
MNNMKRLLTASALVALTGVASAGELIVHGLSWHVRDGYWKNGVYTRFNEVNTGLGYRTDEGYVFGVYHNSYDKPSLYFGYNWSWPVGPAIVAGRQAEVGFTVIGATGYRHRSHMVVTPAGGFNLQVPVSQGVGVLFTVVPVPYERDNGSKFLGTVGNVSLTYRF